MSGPSGTGTSGCPCDGPVPAPPRNPPGLSAIAYRDASFGALRRALLTPLPGETQLPAWRPGAEGDLAVMMAEWWGYLGDILTFYNERIANEDYRRTATQPASLRRLIRLLGYRPQPGIGASATIAALVQPGATNGVTTVLPAGMQVQSKPAPGQAPQVFELAAATPIAAPDLVPASPQLALLAPDSGTLLLAGAVSSIIGGSYLLLRPRDGTAPSLAAVQLAAIVTLPGGAQQTVLTVTLTGMDPTAPAAGFRLEQANQSAGLWSMGGNAIEQSGSAVHLSGLVRTIRLGDTVLFTVQGNAPLLTTVTGIADIIWDATGNPPATPPVSAAIFPHTRLALADALPGSAAAANVTLMYGWVEAARLVDQPVSTWPSSGQPGAPATLVPAGTTLFPATATTTDVLIADTTGAGIAAQASSPDNGKSLTVSGLATPAPVLRTPLSVMFNLLHLTRGQSVPPEVLGSGDPTQANQSFRLAKSPLTYLRKGNAVVSTLSIAVNRQAWTEVDNFYGQSADAQVFVTAQDESGTTTVQFGDGVNGARLPAGTGNVVASYRIGSGAAAPPAGALTVIANPIPGLRALRNPVAAGGGADPDPPDQIRSYAPRSVLTFGRAVSAADFEAIAASVANGNRVSASWAWDSARQRGAVTIHVAGDPATLADVTAALAASGDPNRPVNVVAAQPLAVLVAMEVLISAGAAAADVRAGIVAALTDPVAGLFGAARLGIGQPVFDSQIVAACQAVAGIVAIKILLFDRADTGLEWSKLHTPPEGRYFNLDPSLVWVFPEVAANAG